MNNNTVAKKLEYNIHFIPAEPGEDDELYRNGIFIFNISRMREYLAENPGLHEIITIRTDSFPKSTVLNEEHINTVNVEEPVIIAEIAPGNYNLIDGNHRIEKARRIGLEEISAYRFEMTQHIRFLASKRSYIAYVEYWNNKIKKQQA